jgi:hypothetical protein
MPNGVSLSIVNKLAEFNLAALAAAAISKFCISHKPHSRQPIVSQGFITY